MALSINALSQNTVYPVLNTGLVAPATPINSTPSPLEVEPPLGIDNGSNATRFTPSNADFLNPPPLYTQQGLLNEPLINQPLENSTSAGLSNLQSNLIRNTQLANDNSRLASLSTAYDLTSSGASLTNPSVVDTLV